MNYLIYSNKRIINDQFEDILSDPNFLIFRKHFALIGKLIIFHFSDF